MLKLTLSAVFRARARFADAFITIEPAGTGLPTDSRLVGYPASTCCSLFSDYTFTVTYSFTFQMLFLKGNITVGIFGIIIYV